ncbi:MAG: N-acetylmuramoyl-L-alanine amidase [Chthoniobacterales bacterium]
MKLRCLCSILLALFLTGATAGASWQIRTLGGRDYVPLSQVANFYKMRLVPRGEKGVTLVSETRRMDFNRGSREARIDGVKHWLSFPTIGFGGRLYLSRMDLSKTVDPAMRSQKIPGLQAARTVLLDPGHGGHDRGAVNRWGTEKAYNLAIALEAQRRLREAGLRAELTRSTDRFIPLEMRPAMAGRLGEGTIFVSIHCNASGQSSSPATGFEIFTLTPRGAPNSHDSFLTRRSFSGETGHRFDHANQALAASIYHAMLGRVPMFDRGMKRARFAVLRRAITPAVLVECGFLTNPRDARLMHDPKWRTRLADSIARGIIEYCNLTRAKKAPKLLSFYRKEEAAALAGTEFEYRPLAGIGAAVQPGFASARGWRTLLPVPMVEEMPPFKLEFEPVGWVQLEAWAAAGEDARSMSHDEQAGMMEQSEWPGLAPSFGDLRGWRELLPPSGLDRGFELFPSAAGPIDENHAGDSHGDAVAIPEIEGGRL